MSAESQTCNRISFSGTPTTNSFAADLSSFLERDP